MQHKFEQGRTVLGRYVIERILGEGGMGAVYVARHAELARKRFAVKTLKPELFGIGGLDERFRREADVLAALNHPGIVSIVDYGIDQGTPVMVMELLEGETLRDRLRHHGALAPADAVRIIRETSSALDYTHRCNPPVVHRDLKPENLFLVAPDSRVKVLDFGIAKVTGHTGGHLTQTSTSLGTPQYMSPEQLKDSKNVGPASDIFTLASIAYECLAGRLAFPGEGIGGVVLAIFDGSRPRVRDVRGDLPPGVDAVLARAWSIDPAQRHPSAIAFAEDFAAALSGQTVVSAFGATAPSAPVAQPGAPVLPATRHVGAAMSPGAHAAASPAHGGAEIELSPGARGRRGASRPLLIGGSVAAVAIGAGLVIALLSSSHPPSPRPPRVGGTTPNAVVTEPVIQPGGSGGAGRPVEPVIGPGAQNVTSSVDAGAPRARSDFDVVRESLAGPIAECGRGLTGGSTLEIEITWGGRLGFPLRTAIVSRRAVSDRLRQCISQAVATYGRIPPRSEATITRRFTFVVR